MSEPTKWELAIRRNFPPFALSTSTHVEWKGFSIGPLNWKRGHEIATKFGDEQAWIFMDSELFYVSNVAEIISGVNLALEQALDEQNARIHDIVRAMPGTTREDFAQLNEQHKLAYVLMLIGYDIAGDIRAALEQEISDMSRIEQYIAVASEETAVERERSAMKAGTDPATLAREFGYLHQDYLGAAWTEAEYRLALADGATASAPHTDTPDLSGYTEYQRWLITLFKKNLYLYEEGRNAMVRCAWAMKETARALGEDSERVMYMTLAEATAFGNDAPMIDDAFYAKRQEAYGAAFEGENFTEVEGREAVQKLIKDWNIESFWREETSSAKELKGRIAFKGYAKGKARIVMNQKDADLVEEGDILISPMTQVEFLSGIRKCGAIVTDEGGIVCHAAIVAREFGKPCVLATKEATKIFKTGDTVEVDAEKGVVKKL